MNPEEPKETEAVHYRGRCQKAAGIDDRKPAGEAYVPYGFAELDRACTRFLLEREPGYATRRHETSTRTRRGQAKP